MTFNNDNKNGRESCYVNNTLTTLCYSNFSIQLNGKESCTVKNTMPLYYFSIRLNGKESCNVNNTMLL